MRSMHDLEILLHELEHLRICSRCLCQGVTRKTIETIEEICPHKDCL